MSVGRPKKDMSQDAENKRKKAGERLKMLRQGKITTPKRTERLSQRKLAAILDRDISRIRAYETGAGIPEEIAEKLENLTGIIREYWLGSTDNLTLKDYQTEINERNERIYAVGELDSKVASLDAALSTFFEVCGYSYQHIHTPFVEFASVVLPPSEETKGADPNAGSYYLSSVTYPNIDEVEFTPEEMAALIENVKEMIAFECSKKLRRKQ